MIRIGDYVSFQSRAAYSKLRGIVLEGPRIKHGHSEYRVMWNPTTTPKHWEPRPTVTKIVQVNANGAYVVAVKWFVWNDSGISEEYVSDLKIVSGV